MKKSIILLALAMLILLAGCASITPEPSIGTQTPIIPVTTESVNTDTIMESHIRFDIDIEGCSITVTSEYLKDDLPGSIFLLNRDFKVTKILCDGQEIDISGISKLHTFQGNSEFDVPEYQIGLYHLPSFEKDVRIEYTGTLDGTTGIWPYAQETISPEFTLLRAETFFHPLFCTNEPEDLTQAFMQTTPFDFRITINAPEGYTAAFAFAGGAEAQTPNGSAFTATVRMHYSWIAACIAKYQKVENGSADFYFLENSRLDISAASSPNAEEAARDWFWDAWKQNRLFLDDVFTPEKISVIEIPEGYNEGGNWTLTNKNQYNHFLDRLQVSELEASLDTVPLPFPVFDGDSCSILFVGNSQTNRNGVPELLQALAGMYGIDIDFDQITPDGAGLSDTLERALEAMQAKRYDFAVFQDSMDATDYYDKFMSNMEVLCRTARENGITPVLYAVGVFSPPNTNYESITHYEASLYQIAAKQSHAILVNAGEARVYAYQILEGLSMISADGHLTPEGAYHAACVFASTLFNMHIQDRCETDTIYNGDRGVEIGEVAWEYMTLLKAIEPSAD